MSTLAEKLADAWIKRDLIQLKSDELPKNREDSHACLLYTSPSPRD